jgi:two-component system, OmpR family, phosphate regulon sensor histidine kinase PhoR
VKQTSSLAKLIVFYLILQSGLTLSIILFSLQQDRKASVAEAEEQLFNAVWALIPTVQEHLCESSELAISKLDAIAKGFRKSSGIRVTVIDVDGKVLVDTDADMSKIENHANRPEIIQAKEYGQGTKTRESESTKLEFHYVAIPVEDHVSKRLGYLRCAMATGPIRNRLNTRSLSFISFAGVSTVLATAILFGLGRLMIAPLRDLIAFSKSIAEGKYHQKLGSMRWTGEWKLLGNAFDDMQTELAKRESDLRENGDRLSAVLANMTEGIVAIDGQRRVLFANRAASLLFNVSYQEFVQHPFYEFVRIPVLEDAIEDVFQTHRAAKCELDLGLQPRRIVEIQLAWLSQSDGEVVVIVLHDVTNVRQLETMRRDFVANVSHELKTPLSSIKAYSETLRMGAIDDPQVRTKFVERIEEQTKRLSDLIMDLIQLARIESGIATFEMIDVDLGEIATSRLKAFEEEAEKRHLELKLTVTEPEIWLRCDNEGLVTILDNLIGNAVKYTPEHGTIEVRCSQDNSTRMAIIEVIDNGLGIAPEYQERVFERFFRVDKSRSSDVSGTGLGLSIVKHLAQSFSGQVALSSRLGKGSTFTVRLPLAEASADQIAS